MEVKEIAKWFVFWTAFVALLPFVLAALVVLLLTEAAIDILGGAQ